MFRLQGLQPLAFLERKLPGLGRGGLVSGFTLLRVVFLALARPVGVWPGLLHVSDGGIDLPEHDEHRVFGAGDILDGFIGLAVAVECLDGLIEIAGRLCPQGGGVDAGAGGLLGLGPAPFHEQISLLRIGGNGLTAARLALVEKLFEGGLGLVEHGISLAAVGFGAADADQGGCPPEEHFPLQFRRGLRIGRDPADDLERDIGHLAFFERSSRRRVEMSAAVSPGAVSGPAG